MHLLQLHDKKNKIVKHKQVALMISSLTMASLCQASILKWLQFIEYILSKLFTIEMSHFYLSSRNEFGTDEIRKTGSIGSDRTGAASRAN